jgi:hypothetical protein
MPRHSRVSELRRKAPAQTLADAVCNRHCSNAPRSSALVASGTWIKTTTMDSQPACAAGARERADRSQSRGHLSKLGQRPLLAATSRGPLAIWVSRQAQLRRKAQELSPPALRPKTRLRPCRGLTTAGFRPPRSRVSAGSAESASNRGLRARSWLRRENPPRRRFPQLRYAGRGGSGGCRAVQQMILAHAPDDLLDVVAGFVKADILDPLVVVPGISHIPLSH